MQRVAPTQTASARTLRTSMTDAEHKLWHALRGSQLDVKFRRQHPIDRYIADFVCIEPKLVIEIDGGQHADDAILDVHRTTILEAHGFKVIRFWNNEVLQNLDGVVRVIAQELTPHPHPPLQGAPAAASAGRSVGATHASRNPHVTHPPQKGKEKTLKPVRLRSSSE